MYVAIAVGTLLLGGWVLNSDDENAADQQGQTTASPSDQLRSSSTDAENVRPNPSQNYLRQNGRAGVNAQQQIQRQSVMPFAPTDSVPAGAQAMTGQPTAPTASRPVDNVRGTTMEHGFGSREPAAPTDRSAYFDNYHPSSRGTTSPQFDRTRPSGAQVTSRNVGIMAPSPVAEKAFTGYRPTPGVSPYMNLFRANTGGVDNYTTLVRPQLEQTSLNGQYGRDIRGLETNSRQQMLNMQQMNQERNAESQGVATPQFMNYGNYYNYGNGSSNGNSPNAGQSSGQGYGRSSGQGYSQGQGYGYGQ
jgi:hypothetical protein